MTEARRPDFRSDLDGCDSFDVCRFRLDPDFGASSPLISRTEPRRRLPLVLGAESRPSVISFLAGSTLTSFTEPLRRRPLLLAFFMGAGAASISFTEPLLRRPLLLFFEGPSEALAALACFTAGSKTSFTEPRRRRPELRGAGAGSGSGSVAPGSKATSLTDPRLRRPLLDGPPCMRPARPRLGLLRPVAIEAFLLAPIAGMLPILSSAARAPGSMPRRSPAPPAMLPDRMRPAPSATDDLRAPKFPIEALWSEGETSEGPPKTEVRRLKLGEPAPGAMLLERAKLGDLLAGAMLGERPPKLGDPAGEPR